MNMNGKGFSKHKHLTTKVVVAAVVGVVLIEAKARNVDDNNFVELLLMLKKIFFLHNQMTTF